MNTKIERLFVWEGDTVSAGNPLVQLDGGILLRAPFTGTIAIHFFIFTDYGRISAKDAIHKQ
jgi:hypothetical protein